VQPIALPISMPFTDANADQLVVMLEEEVGVRS
jgi:hypothetical protein